MSKNIRNYFVCANTSAGFVNFFSSNLADLERIYILKGGPGTGKSSLMKKIGKHFLEKGMEIEYIRCSSDPSSLDGIIIKELSTGIVDGTPPHTIEPTAPGAIEEYISLGMAWDSQILRDNTDEILYLKKEIFENYKDLYDILLNAKKYHDSIEKLYIEKTDFNKINQLTNALIKEIFKDTYKDETLTFKHRFFGALTKNDSINYIENLTEDMEKRYFIKGRPGTGKSSLLKKIVSACQKDGLSAEIYHCSLDPESLDMVIIPSLKTCIFDATYPHEIFPSKETDIILDIYQQALSLDTDQVLFDEISPINNKYARLLEEARLILEDIDFLHRKLEDIYVQSMDFTIINQITNDIIDEIEDLFYQ